MSDGNTKTLITAAFGMLVVALTFSMPVSTIGAVQTAKSLYASKCAVCHGNDGSGNTAKGKELKVLNWKTSPEVKAMTDAQLTEIIGKGKGKMEGYEKSLGAEKVAMIVTHVKTLIGK